MPQVFYRKKFSDYLGEQRAIDDIITFFEPLPSPTPTSSPLPITPTTTPTTTPTPTTTLTTTPTPTTTLTTTPTPSITPTNTRTPTVTPTPTRTLPLTPTPTVTKTSTPTPTPTGVIITFATVTSVGCGGLVLSGYTFDITLNSTSATTSTATLTSQIACFNGITAPSISSTYLFTLGNLPVGVDLCDTGIGIYNELYYDNLVYNVDTGNWDCNLNIRYNGTVISTIPTIIQYPTSPIAGCGATLTFNGTQEFYVKESYKLLTENSDFIQTESGDDINIQN